MLEQQGQYANGPVRGQRAARGGQRRARRGRRRAGPVPRADRPRAALARERAQHVRPDALRELATASTRPSATSCWPACRAARRGCSGCWATCSRPRGSRRPPSTSTSQERDLAEVLGPVLQRLRFSHPDAVIEDELRRRRAGRGRRGPAGPDRRQPRGQRRGATARARSASPRRRSTTRSSSAVRDAGPASRPSCGTGCSSGSPPRAATAPGWACTSSASWPGRWEVRRPTGPRTTPSSYDCLGRRPRRDRPGAAGRRRR